MGQGENNLTEKPNIFRVIPGSELVLGKTRRSEQSTYLNVTTITKGVDNNDNV